MAEELAHLNLRKPANKVLLILLLILATGWSYYVLRWYLGNTLAEYFNADENNLEMARIAVALAPNDPLTHWRLAQVSQKKLPLDQVSMAIAEYEKSVSLSPGDYRFWMALGTAREQTGDMAKAEQALRHSIALAPAYAYPHWYLGNLLLRDSRYPEAFAELQFASDADHELRPQLFNLAWQVYNSDFETLQNSVGTDPGTRAEFSLYLVSQNRIEDGLRIWNGLADADKKANKTTGDSIVTSLLGNHRIQDATQVWNSIAPGDVYRAAVGRIIDGGFEESIDYVPDAVFGWQVRNALQMEIGIDPAVAHTGSRSLRLLFQVRGKLDSINASQLVPITANTQYDFEYYVKTQRLQTGGPPMVQISDAATGAVLATSTAAPNGDTDWSQVVISFKTPDKAEGLMIRIVRDTCGQDVPLCPIFGTIWYDDFSLKRRN